MEPHWSIFDYFLPSAFRKALLTWPCESVLGVFLTSKLSLCVSHLLPPTANRLTRLFPELFPFSSPVLMNLISPFSKSPSELPHLAVLRTSSVLWSSLPVWIKLADRWIWLKASWKSLKIKISSESSQGATIFTGNNVKN